MATNSTLVPPSRIKRWCSACGSTDGVANCDRCGEHACRAHLVGLPNGSQACVGCALVAAGVRPKQQQRRPVARALPAWLRI